MIYPCPAVDAEITRRIRREEFLRAHPEYDIASKLTDEQRHERALFEARMRAGLLAPTGLRA